MTWNYRVVRSRLKDGGDWYAVHVAYYDKTGRVTHITQKPVTIEGESVEELTGDLVTIKMDARRRPVLDLDELKKQWKKDRATSSTLPHGGEK